jgi:putative PIN family toxin of toxin-antitoxin system
MRVIADTNVFIDALFHADKECTEILRREHKKELSFIMSSSMLEELSKTVFLHAHALNFTLEEFRQPFYLFTRILRRAIPGEIFTQKTFCSDKDDDKFIQCAIDEEVEYIISSDKHLLGVKDKIHNKNKKAIKIMEPYKFINEHNVHRLTERYNRRRI